MLSQRQIDANRRNAEEYGATYGQGEGAGQSQ